MVSWGFFAMFAFSLAFVWSLLIFSCSSLWNENINPWTTIPGICKFPFGFLGFTAKSFHWVSEEILDFWATLGLLRLWEFLQMDWIHFPLWDGPEPLEAGVQCYGMDGTCPQTFMYWSLDPQCSSQWWGFC
jgi:hypothetical protein